LATLQELEQRTTVRGSKDSSLSAAIAVKQEEEMMDCSIGNHSQRQADGISGDFATASLEALPPWEFPE